MPNIGLPEIIIVLVIALLVFGPKKLPEMGRSLGKGVCVSSRTRPAASRTNCRTRPQRRARAARRACSGARRGGHGGRGGHTRAGARRRRAGRPNEAAANDSPPPPEYDPQAEAEALAAYAIDSHGDPVAQAAPEPVTDGGLRRRQPADASDESAAV